MVLPRIALAALPLFLCASASSLPWISSEEYGGLRIVVSGDAGETDVPAAETFQRYWSETTGQAIPIGHEAGEGVAVRIGRGAVPAAHRAKLGLDSLRRDGIVIRTVACRDGDPGRGLILAGEGDRGTLYAVYEFFDRYMGVRWLAPGVTHIPNDPPASVPKIDYRYAPPFVWRENGYLNAGPDLVELRRAHKLPDRFAHGPFGGHSFYWLVPPDKYFEGHPEYFSEIDGKRIAPAGRYVRTREQVGSDASDVGQLCCSNPEVAEVIAERILKLASTPESLYDDEMRELRRTIRTHPTDPVWSVSQMDWDNHCQCEACRAIDEREGTPMGSLLTLVNRVAGTVSSRYPEHRIHTFAYRYSTRPPKHLRPHPNVVIQLCTSRCDFARPLADRRSRRNRTFAKELRKWSEICKNDNLYVWDYLLNFANTHRPHPNLHVLQPNMRLFARRGVAGVYAQALNMSQVRLAEFRDLRAYLVSKLLWDPGCDVERHRDEFLELYYGAAAPHIRAYIESITRRIESDGRALTFAAEPSWIDYETVVAAQGHFGGAFEAVVDDPEMKARVMEAYVPVLYSALVCPSKATVDIEPSSEKDGVFVLERPPSSTVEEYIEGLEGLGEREFGGWHEPFRDVAARASGRAAGRRGSPIVMLDSRYAEVWVAPAFGGAVIRWRDKRRGIELLRGFRNYGSGPGAMAIWTHAHGSMGRPVGGTFEVVERTGRGLMLERTLPNGLVASEHLALRADSNALGVALTLRNPTDGPVRPGVKFHPEFFTQGARVPEVWVERAEGWTRLKGRFEHAARWNAGIAVPHGITRWACHVPRERLTVANVFDNEEVGLLLFYYDLARDRQQVNLEAIPRTEPLAPGETRTVGLTYSVHRRAPRRLRPAAIR